MVGGMTDTATLTLTDFLLARIAEDERVVRYASVNAHRPALHLDTNGYPVMDPARVLAECEAKRRIVEQLARTERLIQANSEKRAEASRGGLENQTQITALRTHGWELSGRIDALRYAVDELALPYADHPDYREGWRRGVVRSWW